MSAYQPGGRRGPNVSQYIAGLNQIPVESDLAQEEEDDDDTLYNFQKDLELFTNTEFIHNDVFDLGLDLDFDFNQKLPGEDDYLIPASATSSHSDSVAGITNPFGPLVASVIPAKTSPTSSTIAVPIAKKQKLSPSSKKPILAAATVPASTSQTKILPGNGKAPLSVIIPAADTIAAQQPPASTTSQTVNGDMNYDGGYHFSDVGFAAQGNIANHNLPYTTNTSAGTYDFDIPAQSPYHTTQQQLSTPVTTPPNGQQGIRPQGILPDPTALAEASSRAAVEEDKRRRNTAASARFRHKKKQREQALEKSAKDMTDKLDKMEEKIGQLEKENQWLRSLVVERTAKTSEEMAELYKTFKEETSKDIKKRGIGTVKGEN